MLAVNRLAGSYPEARIEVGHLAVGSRAYAERHASWCLGNRDVRGMELLGYITLQLPLSSVENTTLPVPRNFLLLTTTSFLHDLVFRHGSSPRPLAEQGR